MYFSGQGKLYLAKRAANGDALAFRFMGNVPELNINLTTDTVEHKESQSGLRVVDFRLTRQQKIDVTFMLEEFSSANLAFGLYGASAVIAGSSVLNEMLPNPVAVGDYVRLKYGNVSAPVMDDSLTAPMTLGTHYEIASASHGMVKILSLGAFTQPFKIDYTYGAQVNVLMFSTAPEERWLRFEGLNTANASAPVLIELYRCSLDPMKNFNPINDDLNKFDMTGSALYDSTKAADTVLGTFGRVNLLSATG